MRTEILTHHKTFVFTPNIAAGSYGLLTSSWQNSAIKGKAIRIHGLFYAIRFALGQLPNITPDMSVMISREQITDALFANSSGMEGSQIIHLDSYSVVPLKDTIEFPGGPQNVGISEMLNLGIFIENRDLVNAFSVPIRVHTTFYYEIDNIKR